nr:amino acid adenylation domain-containing protein [Streptomyces sp. SID5473]
MVGEQALRVPGRIAVRDQDGSWTYRQLMARAEELGVLLEASGVRPGDRVAIHLDRSRDLVAGLLAALTIGCAYLPLDPEYPADRLRFMIDDARPAAVLTRRGIEPPSPPGDHRLVYTDERPGSDGQRTAALDRTSEAHHAAFVIYTSGSTGTPKGAVLTHRGIADILQYSRDDFCFTEEDSVLALAPFSFDFAQLEILLPLICGGTVHVVDRAVARDPGLLDEAIAERGATFLMGTPSLFTALTSYGWQPPRHLRIVSGGEALTPALARSLDQARAVWNIYGPTETSVYSLSEKVRPDDITIGRPAARTVVEILRDGRRCADDETGEIHIGGPGLAIGYLDRPELTAQRFIPDPFRPGERLYRTGDLGRRRSDGRIAYEGRTDDQVKIRGHRVEPAEVEDHLLRLGGVRAAAVVAEQGHHALRLVGYVVPPEGAAVDTGELRSLLGSALPAYSVPHRIVAVREIPLSPNGKTDRRALSRLARPGPHGGDGLAGIWRDVLGVTRINPEDNFFDLGGDSLSAMEVAIRAGDLGLRIRPADVYTTGTFGELAERAFEPASVPAPETVARPDLSPAQHRFLGWDYQDRDHYNVSLVLDVDASVDREALAGALAALARRHSALRLRLVGNRIRTEPYSGPTDVPLSRHDLSGPGPGDRDQAFLKEADRLHQSLSLRDGPVWRAAYFSSADGDVLLLVFHHLVADGMSLKVIARELVTAYREIAAGVVHPLAGTSSWSDHAAVLRRLVNGPLGALFLRRWRALRWESLRPLPSDRPDGSMHLSHIKSLQTLIPRPAAPGAARVEELLLSALAAAAADATNSRVGAVDVCRHGRTDPTGGPGFANAVGWLNSIAPYLLELPEEASDRQTAQVLREQITDIRDMEQTWGALRYLHDLDEVRGSLAALPAADIYLNFLGSRMGEHDLEPPFRVRATAVGTEMTPNRTQPYRIKVYAGAEPDFLRLTWQYSADVDREEQIRGLAAACERWMSRLSG